MWTLSYRGVKVTQTERIMEALALTESEDNANAPFGDHGRALGRWQVHPDWLWGWAKRAHLAPFLNEKWNDFIERVVMSFVNYAIKLGLEPIGVALYFNRGHVIYVDDKEWQDPAVIAYRRRFSEKFAQISK